VCAAVVGTAAEAELRRQAEHRLAPYKRPKSYLLVDELPRTATGKVLRRALPAQVAGIAARPSAGSGDDAVSGCPPEPRRGGS
jgi:acyl-CoA synthetase (AMP-forming)/AMP-acid ligase II